MFCADILLLRSPESSLSSGNSISSTVMSVLTDGDDIGEWSAFLNVLRIESFSANLPSPTVITFFFFCKINNEAFRRLRKIEKYSRCNFHNLRLFRGR